MSAPHDPWKDVGIELLTLEDSRVIERLLAVINAARAADAERHQAEIDANDKHIFVAEHIITQHGEFGGLFQPGGRFHRVANLMLGGSAVVDGGKWLVEQYDAQAQEIATLRATVDQQQARIAELESALKGVMPFVATQRMACSGLKCREMWCESCFGEDEAEAFAQAGCEAMGQARQALETPWANSRPRT